MIKLTDKYYISAEKNNYILGTPSTDKNGSTRLNNACYYSTLGAAVRATVSKILRDKVADNSITTLRDFIAESERLNAELTELTKPLNA